MKVQCAHEELQPIEELKAHPKNPNQHPERQVELLAKIIAATGWRSPIVVSKRSGFITKGHGRLLAAFKAGFTEVPVDLQDYDSEEEELADMVADNDIADLAEMDLDMRSSILEELEAMDYPMELVDFSEAEEEEPFAGLTDEDSLPDEVEQKTKPGELWQLGEHRLLCGDCRDADSVARLMDGRQINVAITSPPYASQRKYDEESGFKPIHPDAFVEWFDGVQKQVAAHLASDGSWFVNIKEHCEEGQRVLYVKDLTLAHVREWGWRFVDEYIWTHGGTPKIARARFKNGWEPIFQFTRDSHKFRPESVMHPTDSIPDWKEEASLHGGEYHPSMRSGLVQGRRKTYKGPIHKVQGLPGSGAAIHNAIAESASGMAYPSNVLSLGKNREALGHSAAYPVALPEFFIKACSDEADAIYDPFLGSGTTLIAAERLSRNCYGLEISAEYCDIIIRRWEDYTGKSALLIA